MSRRNNKDTSKRLASELADVHQNILLFKTQVKLGMDISVEQCWQLHDQIAELNKNDDRTYSHRIEGYSTLLDHIYGWEEVNTDISNAEATEEHLPDAEYDYSKDTSEEEEEEEDDDDDDDDEYDDSELDKSEIILIKTAAFKDILKIAKYSLHDFRLKPDRLAQLTDALNQILVDFAKDKALATLFMPHENPAEELEILCCQLLEKADKSSLELQRAYASQHAAEFETERGKIALLDFALNFGAKFHELNNMLPCDILKDVLPELSNILDLNPVDDHEILDQKWQTRQRLMFYFKGDFENILPKSQWVSINDSDTITVASEKDIAYHTQWHEAQFLGKDIQIDMPTEKQVQENNTGDYSDYTVVRDHGPEDAHYGKLWQQEITGIVPQKLPAELAPEKVEEKEKNYKKFLMN